MKVIKQNNKGAILVLVLLVSSIVITTGTALLSTSVMNLKMKKLNSRVKRAFYAADGALEEAYIITLDFIESALGYAYNKENSQAAYLEFLLGNCSDLIDHNGLAEILEDKNNYYLFNESNTTVSAYPTKKENYIKLEIVSHCTDKNIKKEIKLICRILIPDDGSSFDIIHAKDLICIDDWKLER